MSTDNPAMVFDCDAPGVQHIAQIRILRCSKGLPHIQRTIARRRFHAPLR